MCAWKVLVHNFGLSIFLCIFCHLSPQPFMYLDKQHRNLKKINAYNNFLPIKIMHLNHKPMFNLCKMNNNHVNLNCNFVLMFKRRRKMDANEICKEQMKFLFIYFSILLANHKNIEKRFGYASIMELASMLCKLVTSRLFCVD